MGNRQLDELDEWLARRDFHELTDDEKALVNEEIGGEETYNRLRQMHSQVVKGFAPSKATKRKLMTHFKDQNRSVLYRVIHFKIPAFASSIAVLLFAAFTWFIRPVEQVVIEKPIYVKGEVVVDTLVIRELDTVFVEKPVLRTVHVQSNPPEPVGDQQVVRKSKSLAQQTDLRDILVRSD